MSDYIIRGVFFYFSNLYTILKKIYKLDFQKSSIFKKTNNFKTTQYFCFNSQQIYYITEESLILRSINQTH